jgi:hypothetical protein
MNRAVDSTVARSKELSLDTERAELPASLGAGGGPDRPHAFSTQLFADSRGPMRY